MKRTDVSFSPVLRRSYRGASRRENRKSHRGGRWSLPREFLGCSQDILRPGREIPYLDACLRYFLVSTFHTTFETSDRKIEKRKARESRNLINLETKGFFAWQNRDRANDIRCDPTYVRAQINRQDQGQN